MLRVVAAYKFRTWVNLDGYLREDRDWLAPGVR